MQENIVQWHSIVKSSDIFNISEDTIHAAKAYDHLVASHLIEQILRYGNLIQFSTFGTEHDNALVRGCLQRHTMRGGGPGGLIGEMKQCMERLCVMRSNAVTQVTSLRSSSKATRIVAPGSVSHGKCECEYCGQLRQLYESGQLDTRH